MGRSLIERRVRWWQRKLLLSDWKITVEIGPTDDGVGADCEANPEYKDAQLRFDPDRVPDGELDAWVVHELLHCITWRLENLAEVWGKSENHYTVARDIAETTVTDLERAILHVAGRR